MALLSHIALRLCMLNWFVKMELCIYILHHSSHDDVIKWKHFPRYWPFVLTSEFPSQRPVTRSFDVFFDLRLSKRLSKQSRRRWFEMPSHSLWSHCSEIWHGVGCWNPPSIEMKHTRLNIIKLMMAWVTSGAEAYPHLKKNNWFIQKFSSIAELSYVKYWFRWIFLNWIKEKEVWFNLY